MLRQIRNALHASRLVCALLMGLGASACIGGESADSAESNFSRAQLDEFEKEVRPILVKHCFECHSGKSKKLHAGLRVDSRAGLLAGGDSGPAIDLDTPKDSLLIQAIRYDSFEMPPKGRLPEETVNALQKWIEEGCAWPPGETVDEGVENADVFDWQERAANHWSWHPLTSVTPPAVHDLSNPEWPRSPIDAFVLRRLDEVGLQPAAVADRRMLIRRVYFDLIGLPPTPQQIADFLADDELGAFERVVDGLLASPHFGEKWARHWLDLVRYAESYGHEFDYTIPHAWRYRDYVIQAINEDVGYDQFLREHFAGDLLIPPRRDKQTRLNQSVMATGFWFLGEATHAPTDVLEDEATRIENQIDVMCRSFMALSVSCARCHDHKFDPIPTDDYYSLSGVMKSSRRHIASLYPENVVEQAKEEMAAVDDEAQTFLDRAVCGTSLTGAELANRLRSLVDEMGSDKQRIAEERDDHWIGAVQSKECADISHPFWLWNQAVERSRAEKQSEEDEKNPNGQQSLEAYLGELRSQVADQFQTAQNLASQVDQDWDVIEPFHWFIDGYAFESSRIGSLRIGEHRDHVVSEEGYIAGRLTDALPGVIRSPGFKLDGKGEVRVRLRGKNVVVALIVNGYYMQPFNGLLFNGTRLEGEALGDSESFVWHTLGNPLQKDRDAYIEISVEKDGYVEVGEIRVSKSDRRQIEESSPAWVVELAANKDSLSYDEMAQEFGAYWENCRERWSRGKQDSDDAQLVDWLVHHELLRLPTEWQATKESFALAMDDLPEPVRVLAITEGSPIDSPVAIRGTAANQGPRVPRHLPVAMGGESQPPVAGSGRLEFAERLLRDENPFPSRVEVNRLWHHLFGMGLVSTVCDFGAMGQPPSHPELLDWLAEDFRNGGWSRKRMIRQLVLSQTYRMSSVPADGDRTTEIDPDNRWLHRMSVRRLTAEAIRDQLLMVAGKLKSEVGGKSVPVFLTPFMEGRGKPEAGPRDSDGRRSLYVAIRRNFLPTDLLAFDFPKPLSSIGKRTQSNVPAQSLFMMNNPFVREQAELLAKQLLAEHSEPLSRINALFETAIGIAPSKKQVADCNTFLSAAAEEYDTTSDTFAPWADLCHVIFNLKDFIFVR